MHNSSQSTFDQIEFVEIPFPHFSAFPVFSEGQNAKIFDWFVETDQWNLTEAAFYTQYEFSVLYSPIPPDLDFLIGGRLIDSITGHFAKYFGETNLKLVEVTAHKLVDGHRMGIHNDFIGPDETHRLVIQINQGWTDAMGGYLMFFNSERPDDVAKIVLPLNNSAVGFEISENSFHAVSTVRDFSRYTIVYTFKRG